MPLNGVEVLETILRDGLQSPKVNLNKPSDVDKALEVARIVDELGYADYIEAGFAGSNTINDRIIREISKMGLKAKIAAFGQTRKPYTRVEDYDANPGIKSLLGLNTPVVVLVYKSWDHQVNSVLRTDLEENIRMLKDTVKFFVAQDRKVIVDAEFASSAFLGDPYDKIPNNFGYLLRTMKVAADAGASKLVLCDTRGILLPQHFNNFIGGAIDAIGNRLMLGIHLHQDHSMGDALTDMAFDAGLGHLQTSFAGTGERIGNASGIVMLGNLTSPYRYNKFELDLRGLTTSAQIVYRLLTGKELPPDTPFVGKDAFKHTGGMHSDGDLKDPNAYNGRRPEEFGNKQYFHLSLQAGRANFARILGLDKRDPLVERVYKAAINLMQEGYDFNEFPDFLTLTSARLSDGYKPPFQIVEIDVREKSTGTGLDDKSILEVDVQGKIYKRSIKGNEGEVDASNRILIEILSNHYNLPELQLIGYNAPDVSGYSTSKRVCAEVSYSTKNGDLTYFRMPHISHSVVDASVRAIASSLEYLILTGRAQPKTLK